MRNPPAPVQPPPQRLLQIFPRENLEESFFMLTFAVVFALDEAPNFF